MDKAEFRASIELLGLSVEKFATLTGWSERTVYAWGDRTPVPYQARVIIVLLAERSGIDLDINMQLPSITRPTIKRDPSRFKVF